MLVCFGSPIIDLIAKIPINILNNYNLTLDQCHKVTSENAGIFTEIKTHNPVCEVGGSVTNTVRIFKQISRDSYDVVYVGAVGKDNHGEYLKQQMGKEHITYIFMENEYIETGKCAVLICDKWRTLVTDLGASAYLKWEYLLKNGLKECLNTAEVLYVSALFINVSKEIVRNVYNYFIENNKKIVMNLGAAFLYGEENADDVLFMCRNANVIVGNEAEFSALSKISNIQPDSNTHRMLHEYGEKYCITSDQKCQLIIVTRSSQPVLVFDNGSVKEYNVGHLDHVVNTNGAGDAFIGGFLAKFVTNSSIDQCISYAILTAKTVIQNGFYIVKD